MRSATVPGVRRPVAAAFAYSGAARDLILGLKLRARRTCAGPLADGLVSLVRRDGLLAEVVTWVPGRARDIRMRGFDHAELLARSTARSLGLPAAHLLRRRGDSQDQSGLPRVARMSNVHGAFVARGSAGAVVLIDDLITTGATARACVQALLAGGAETVEVLVAAAA